MEKKISLCHLYATNILLFLTFAVSTHLIETTLKIGYIFLVLLIISIFETLFFYKKNDRSFAKISGNQSIEIVLLSISSTVILVGSVLFIIAVFRPIG